MMIRALIGILAVVVTFAGATEDSRAAGNPQKGSQVFRQCLACHSLEPGRHLTGPSLANIWGRKAGTAKEFYRYSKALKSADITWNAETLDAWLKNPSAFISNNSMGFVGIERAHAREDLIAYLKVATSSEHAYTKKQLATLHSQIVSNLEWAWEISGGSEDQLLSTMMQISQVVARQFNKQE